jgi:hypothetical protein
LAACPCARSKSSAVIGDGGTIAPRGSEELGSVNGAPSHAVCARRGQQSSPPGIAQGKGRYSPHPAHLDPRARFIGRARPRHEFHIDWLVIGTLVTQIANVPPSRRGYRGQSDSSPG